MITDYIIESVQNPSFEENIGIMLNNIADAGGNGPTIIGTNQQPMVGTKSSSGRIMLHFRLYDLYEGSDLIDFLEQGMVNPKPPVSIRSTVSAFKEVKVDTGEIDPETGDPIYTYEYLVTVQALQQHFNKYMVVSKDEEGNTLPISTNLSYYSGSDSVELL